MRASIRSLNDFLALLKGVKKTHDGQYLALRPGHNDQNPSLSIKEAGGKILLKCFAGCELADILKPLELEPKVLFLNSHRTKLQHRQIETIYCYTECRPSAIMGHKRNGTRYPNGFALVKAGEKKRAVTWKAVRFENETSPQFSFKGEVGEVDPDDILDYPTHPCHNCGCGDYWLPDWNQWLCSRCHPKPEGSNAQ